MPAVVVRPAAPADVGTPGLLDLLPDHWREGGNRRSLVAVSGDGRVLGHCRGIDNVFHPGSRVYVTELLPDAELAPLMWADVADALLAAQREVSTLPLCLKPDSDDDRLVGLCARNGGVLVQLMPPWRYPVDAALQAWARDHLRTPDGLQAQASGTDRTEEMLDLYVEHYTAQHAAWSPAAEPAVLREENAPDFVPGSTGAFDPRRSTILVRDEELVAHALTWPPEPDGEVEISLQCRPHDGPSARSDMESCLAAAILAAPEGSTLLIDSHAVEALESAMLKDVPRPEGDLPDTWTAIVAFPVAGGPTPIRLPAGRVPAAAQPFAAALHSGH